MLLGAPKSEQIIRQNTKQTLRRGGLPPTPPGGRVRGNTGTSPQPPGIST